MRLHLPFFIAAFAAAALCPAARGAPVDFARDVRPIFAAHCYECHGPDKQKASLRLDARATALRGGVSGNTIVPGKSASSHLLERLRGLGGEDRMPLKKPPQQKPRLRPRPLPKPRRRKPERVL